MRENVRWAHTHTENNIYAIPVTSPYVHINATFLNVDIYCLQMEVRIYQYVRNWVGRSVCHSESTERERKNGRRWMPGGQRYGPKWHIGWNMWNIHSISLFSNYCVAKRFPSLSKKYPRSNHERKSNWQICPMQFHLSSRRNFYFRICVNCVIK